MIFTREKIEELIAHANLSDAAAALAVARAENQRTAAALCDVSAGVYALAGDDRGLARVIPAELLACGSSAAVTAYYAASGTDPSIFDHLSGAVALAWSGDRAGTYESLNCAHDVALNEGRVHYAVGARERLAHHALLFGDIERATAAVDDAIALAEAHHLSEWLTRCLAAAAHLALDAGDLDRASQLVVRGQAESRDRDTLALFAPSGAQLAVELRDDVALRVWSSEEIFDVALHSQRPAAAIAATVAALIGGGAVSTGAPVATALRRALLLAESAATAAELFTLAARYGNPEEVLLGTESLAGVIAPDRAYLKAHYLLARAYWLMRSGEASGWVDSAGDAARAFNAMGLRRWTNDAMLLLVAQEPVTQRRQRGRSSGSVLTGREQQVAHLIRRGARNREVALALQISEHTVERHVSSILGRLGLRSRWQIVDPKRVGDN
jgi:DNA-binding CsgD family transcriptional regulator